VRIRSRPFAALAIASGHLVRRLRARIGLRGQLALALACVAVLGVGLSYLALYRDTGSRLRSQIDNDLRTQLAEWEQATRGAAISTPGSLRRAAQTFIADQRYHAASRVFVIQVAGAPTVTNDEAILHAETERAHRSSSRKTLLDAPLGLADIQVSQAGSMRVLTEPIAPGGTKIGTFRVANPLTPVAQAQSSMRRSFGVVGVAALIIAIVAAIALAALIAAPLRRMTRVAAQVEGGNLSTRAGDLRATRELRLLAEAFDHMLDRVQRSFQQQRDFVSDAAHELRTPLTILRMQIELLDHQTDPAHREDTTKPLLRRLAELDRLVADMLTLARAEAGQLIESRPINLRLFFEDIRRDLPLFGDRDFQLSRPTARSTAIQIASPRSCATCYATRSRTPTPTTRSRSQPDRSTAGLRSPSATPAPGYPANSSSTSSNGSCDSIGAAPEAAKALGSDSQSRARLPRHTVAGSTPYQNLATAPRSPSSFPATTLRRTSSHTIALAASRRRDRRRHASNGSLPSSRTLSPRSPRSRPTVASTPMSS
jgi:HAMP domain-containing protein